MQIWGKRRASCTWMGTLMVCRKFHMVPAVKMMPCDGAKNCQMSVARPQKQVLVKDRCALQRCSLCAYKEGQACSSTAIVTSFARDKC